MKGRLLYFVWSLWFVMVLIPPRYTFVICEDDLMFG